MRIEPPPSLACATGTMPAATAAADPPDEPPGVRARSQGLWVAPKRRGSVVGRMANSGVLVFPQITKPASQKRVVMSWSSGDRYSPERSVPSLNGVPASSAAKSFKRNGTPRNGPSGSLPLASARARSKSGWITALSAGFRRSIRSIAPSTNSCGDAAPLETSCACAVASSHWTSVIAERYPGPRHDVLGVASQPSGHPPVPRISSSEPADEGIPLETLRTPDERFASFPDYPFAPHYVELGGGMRVHYVDEGPPAAAPVLLLHGEPTWSYLYRHMIPILVAAGHRCLAPDLVGFGRSDKPSRPEDYSYRGHVDWMREAIFDRLDL